MSNGVEAWAFSSTKYVQTAVKNVEEYLVKKVQSLKAKALDPLSKGYCPEIDVSEELEPEEASYYMSLIGIVWWMVELGRVDICTEVSIMSSLLDLPREGHLEAVLHMFAYLKKNHNSEMVFDPSELDTDMSDFPREDSSLSIYGDVKEDIPPTCPFSESGPSDMPAPRGEGFTINIYSHSALTV